MQEETEIKTMNSNEVFKNWLEYEEKKVWGLMET